MISRGIAAEIAVSDEDVERFYEQNISEMQRPVEVHARHILIKAESADTEAIQSARAEIDSILVDIHAGKDFVELATTRSQAPSAPRGGDLGYFAPGQMVAPFEKAAFALQPGEVSEVVQTQFGYHIIRLENRRGGDIAPVEVVAEKIRAYLGQEKLQTEVETLVTRLREEGEVEIFLN
jgi:peptidyl-prolyl cis-trans isomerase C